MATAGENGARPRRVNPTGGGNEPWRRQGQDCALLLRGFEEGAFATWQEFLESPGFHIFERKYIRDNLQRNFDTTKDRWERYHRDGSGDISESLRELAQLPPPRLDGGGGPGDVEFVLGNDGGDDEEDLIAELQGPRPAARPAAQPAQQPCDLDLQGIVDGLRNLGVEADAMKGCFIQEVTDPEDPSRTRNRLGIYCVLYGGVHVDLVEVRRTSDNSVKFCGLMDSRVGSARNLLGHNLADAGTVRALQASIDGQLRVHQSQGGNNDGSLPAEAAVTLPPSPNGLGWRPGFIGPSDNNTVGDPLFFNRIASVDPEMQSDTMAFFCFLMENKATDGAAPARGRRDRRAQLARAPAPAAAPVPRHHRNRAAQQPQPIPMNVDQGGTAPLVNVALVSAARRPRNTRASSPRRRQRLDEVASYIEESDEVENNVETSFESAQSNEYSDDYDDDDDDGFGIVETVSEE